MTGAAGPQGLRTDHSNRSFQVAIPALLTSAEAGVFAGVAAEYGVPDRLALTSTSRD